MQLVIIGAGPAGLTVAEGVRQHALDADITMLSTEPYPPYAPPAMADYFVTGREQSIFWKGRDVCDRLGIDYLPGTRVERVQTEVKTLTLDSGATLPYDQLVIASGSSLYDGGSMHVIFGSYDSSQGSYGRIVYQPTNFASIDALWSNYYAGSPAGYVDLRAYGDNNTLLSTYRYNYSGGGTFSNMSVFNTNIYRISITPGPDYSHDIYGLDNLYFMDSSTAGTLFNLSDNITSSAKRKVFE